MNFDFSEIVEFEYWEKVWILRKSLTEYHIIYLLEKNSKHFLNVYDFNFIKCDRFECYSLENEWKLHQKYRFLIIKNKLKYLSKICVFNIENTFYLILTSNKFVNKKRQN